MAARLTLWLLVPLLCGCGRSAPAPLVPAAFSGSNAWQHVERLVALGPRPAGSAAGGRAAALIAAELRRQGWAVEEEVFHAGTPTGARQFRNVIARPAGRRGQGTGRVVVLGSHYDTKELAGVEFVGANDGGSSTGVLLEIARVAAGHPGLWLVFFDGEEAVDNYTAADGLYGSRFFVANLQAAGALGRVRAFILLDMVGDRDLHMTMPGNSDGQLVQEVFQAATTLGYRDRFSFRPGEMIDDHVPFRRAGVPAVDLIDFEFGSAPGRNDYWHTAADTLDKLSPASLEIAGRTVLQTVNQLAAGAGP